MASPIITAEELFRRVEYYAAHDPRTRALRKAAQSETDWDNLVSRDHGLPHENVRQSVARCKRELDSAEANGSLGRFSVISQIMALLADELSGTCLGPDGKPSVSDEMIDSAISSEPRRWSETKRSAIRTHLEGEISKVRAALLETLERAQTLVASAPQLEKRRAMRESRDRIADNPKSTALQAELAECLRQQAAMIRKGHRFLSSDAQRYQGEALAHRITELQVALEPRYQPIQ